MVSVDAFQPICLVFVVFFLLSVSLSLMAVYVHVWPCISYVMSIMLLGVCVYITLRMHVSRHVFISFSVIRMAKGKQKTEYEIYEKMSLIQSFSLRMN